MKTKEIRVDAKKIEYLMLESYQAFCPVCGKKCSISYHEDGSFLSKDVCNHFIKQRGMEFIFKK